MAIISIEEPPEENPQNKSSSKDLCRYFRKGFCGLNEKCPYRHNPRNCPSPNNASEAPNCKFYKTASCKFASKCWYKHIGPNGKVYPRPDPLNKFIVLGPVYKEPDATEDTQTPVEESGTSVGVNTKETVIRRSFKKPENQNVSKDCFHYQKEGGCYFRDKCWYSHSKPHADPVDELPSEPTLEPEPEPYAQPVDGRPPEPTLEPDPNRKMCLNFSFMECGGDCGYAHGDICQFCNGPFLHPFNEKQRREHIEACEMYGYRVDKLPLEPTLEDGLEYYSISSDSSDELLPEATLIDRDYKKLCLNFSFLECELGDKCPYAHGDICEFCDLPLLHPSDEQERKAHLKECKRLFKVDMNIAFEIMLSKDKTCVICLELVWGSEKKFTKQKFGIQENCNHIFCLNCIRRWRDEKRKNNEPQHCPACRQESNVIYPSSTWFLKAEVKKKWIENYKAAMKKKPCKFLAKGKCRNKDKCNYDHGIENRESFLIENRDTDDFWGNREAEDSAGHQYQHDDSENLGTEAVTDHQYQEDAERHYVQDQESRINTWIESQTYVCADTQSDEQAVSSNFPDQYQNEERQVREDPGICYDALGNQPSEELLSQSSDETRSRNLAETISQQLEGNIEQEDEADESLNVCQNLDTSFETSQDEGPDDPSPAS